MRVFEKDGFQIGWSDLVAFDFDQFLETEIRG
jgi:hypothetical protein